MLDAYIFDGIRSPFGRYAGAVARVRPDDLAAATLASLLTRVRLDPQLVEEVVIGCANQAGEDSRNVARQAALLAGLPVEVAATTVNRLCGSSLSAVVAAAHSVALGEGQFIIAGGVESMSRAPLVITKSQRPYDRNPQLFDTTIGPRFPNPEFARRFGYDTMAQTAENVAREIGIGREESDRFAALSQEKYRKAYEKGYYEDEVFPLKVPSKRRGEDQTVGDDEHPRPGTRVEDLEKLRPLYEGGIVTAGNATGLNDGAAAVLVGTLEAGRDVGLIPRARIVSAASAGVPPRTMGIGPVTASKKALARAKLTLADIDVIEINEAFACQVLGCLKMMEIEPDDGRLNPNGGAIAIGHPLGASGCRLLLTAMRQLHVTGKRYALVSLCVGGGQGVAAVLERM